jgi:hypothetical protein
MRWATGLMKPDSHLGENFHQIEVSDDSPQFSRCFECLFLPTLLKSPLDFQGRKVRA